ncbi:MAG TPA: aminotransferase class V-fold PLP-dependent enzyme [Streptosporangiaceae bacterium]|nr:aminotransferase class V-fold PLP-dependent enzyme [Streptosporangiaceae bacterium]
MAYFDAASAEPLHPAARETLLAALSQGWADPARLHREGRLAATLLDSARERVAAILACRPDEVSFTSSGTQAAHLAVLGVARARRAGRTAPPHLVLSEVEHSSVLNAAAWLEADGAELTMVGVDATGRADPQRFAAALRPGGERRDGTVLACLQAANPEVGTVQPAGQAAAACAALGVPLLVDAAAAAGREPIPAGWSLLAASAHKWGGPAGVGVLAVRKGTRWRSPLPADEREGRRVPGYPNVPAILAASEALAAMDAERLAEGAALRALTDEIRAQVPVLVPDSAVHGDPAGGLAHIVAFSCLYVDGEALVTELDKAGFAVSSGSACAAETGRPSHVLAAMGALTHGNVRVSLPRGTTPIVVAEFLAVLPGIVAGLRDMVGPATPRSPGSSVRG